MTQESTHGSQAAVGASQVRLRTVVLGGGNIGTDLLHKIVRSERLQCVQVVGRRPGSTGMRLAEKIGVPFSSDGVATLVHNPDSFDVVFDCTDAAANREHWRALAPLAKRMINLTPGFSGKMIVPSVNGCEATTSVNVNMVSCGGQAAIPLLVAVEQGSTRIDYAEVVTSASSSSVGAGTRANLDEYIEITTAAMRELVRLSEVKCMLNLSPAHPPVVFRVTMFIRAEGLRMNEIEKSLQAIVNEIHGYCSGYKMTACDLRRDGTLVLEVEVRGGSDSLPEYSGNLDLINSAAIRVGETML